MKLQTNVTINLSTGFPALAMSQAPCDRVSPVSCRSPSAILCLATDASDPLTSFHGDHLASLFCKGLVQILTGCFLFTRMLNHNNRSEVCIAPVSRVNFSWKQHKSVAVWGNLYFGE